MLNLRLLVVNLSAETSWSENETFTSSGKVVTLVAEQQISAHYDIAHIIIICPTCFGVLYCWVCDDDNDEPLTCW